MEIIETDCIIEQEDVSPEYATYVKEAFDYYKSRASRYDMIHQYFDGFNQGITVGRSNLHHYHLSRFAVNLQGQGLGKKIIKHLQDNYQLITLWSNSASVEFYRKCGFIFTEKTIMSDDELYTYGVWLYEDWS